MVALPADERRAPVSAIAQIQLPLSLWIILPAASLNACEVDPLSELIRSWLGAVIWSVRRKHDGGRGSGDAPP